MQLHNKEREYLLIILACLIILTIDKFYNTNLQTRETHNDTKMTKMFEK